MRKNSQILNALFILVLFPWQLLIQHRWKCNCLFVNPCHSYSEENEAIQIILYLLLVLRDLSPQLKSAQATAIVLVDFPCKNWGGGGFVNKILLLVKYMFSLRISSARRTCKLGAAKALLLKILNCKYSFKLKSCFVLLFSVLCSIQLWDHL